VSHLRAFAGNFTTICHDFVLLYDSLKRLSKASAV
jgi:hypothetical protein